MKIRSLPPFQEYICYLGYSNYEKRKKVYMCKGGKTVANINLSNYLMCLKLKRRLTSREEVHHINHDRLDDRITNLTLVRPSEHTRIHMSTGVTIVVIACPMCNKEFQILKSQFKYKLNKLKRVSTCSPECGNIFKHKVQPITNIQPILREYKICTSQQTQET